MPLESPRIAQFRKVGRWFHSTISIPFAASCLVKGPAQALAGQRPEGIRDLELRGTARNKTAEWALAVTAAVDFRRPAAIAGKEALKRLFCWTA